MRFSDRREAGRRVAEALSDTVLAEPVVLALPRGGVPVGFEVARALKAPLDAFVARKIGAPGRPELGIGAIAEGGVHVLDERTVEALDITPAEVAALTVAEQRELERRVDAYRGDRQLPALTARDVILVDDGLATGVTAEAALKALQGHDLRQLVLAVPVCPPQTRRRLEAFADLVVCVHSPSSFHAVGTWYDDFTQTTDEEVARLLAAARHADRM